MTGQIRDTTGMKTQRSNSESDGPNGGPITVSEGSISVKIYPTVNRIYRRNLQTGDKELKSEHPQFTLAYYSGSHRVKEKFSDEAKAQARARLVVTKLANGETEILKLTGADSADYVKAMERLREVQAKPDLNLAIADYVASVKRLPESVTLRECTDFYLRRQCLPNKTVQEIVDELIESKRQAGKSEIYLGDLGSRLNQFAKAFQVRLSTVTGIEIERYIRSLGAYFTTPGERKYRPLSGRSQNNHRRIIGTLIRFAIHRRYLSKDYKEELEAVEKVNDDNGEIEIFTPDELHSILNACLAPVTERGALRTRAALVPYVAIGAFAGLRAAELERLDWSEVNIPGRFIEVKASKSKTKVRRLAPITENLAVWLAPYAQASGSVAPFANMSKQLTMYLAPGAGVTWKHNGLRHSFVSYRLADVKDVARVAEEAGNSPQMAKKHYLKVVTEGQAKTWFAIMPPQPVENILPLVQAQNA